MKLLKRIEEAQEALRRLLKDHNIDPMTVTEALSAYLVNLGLSSVFKDDHKAREIFQRLHGTEDLNDALDQAYKLGEKELARKGAWERVWKTLTPLIKDVLFKVIVKGKA